MISYTCTSHKRPIWYIMQETTEWAWEEKLQKPEVEWKHVIFCVFVSSFWSIRNWNRFQWVYHVLPMHGLVSFVVIHHSLVVYDVVNGQYQNGKNTKQNQMKNTYLFYIVFQVLKVLLIKIFKIQQPYLLFLFVFISFYISRYHFLQNFRTSFKNIWKKYFHHEFFYLTDSLRLPTPLKAKIH